MILHRSGRGKLGRVLKKASARWIRHDAMRLSAALSFYSILVLAPLLVIIIKVAGLLWRGQGSASDHVTRQLSSLMGPQAADAIGQMIEAGGRQGAGVVATTISTGLLIASATGVFTEVQDGMNAVWEVKKSSRARERAAKWGRDRLLSLAMVAGVGLLLLASVLVSTTLTAAAKYIADDKSVLVIFADVIVSFGLAVVLFAAIFKFLPDVVLAWRHVWTGAVITAVLFTVGKYALAAYFKYAMTTSAFGAAGSLTVVLLWVYYSAFSLFFGAECTRAWATEQAGG
jgi:membrane protein